MDRCGFLGRVHVPEHDGVDSAAGTYHGVLEGYQNTAIQGPSGLSRRCRNLYHWCLDGAGSPSVLHAYVGLLQGAMLLRILLTWRPRILLLQCGSTSCHAVVSASRLPPLRHAHSSAVAASDRLTGPRNWPGQSVGCERSETRSSVDRLSWSPKAWPCCCLLSK